VLLFASVADPGSGAFLTLDTGSEKVFSGSRISDPRSQANILNSLMKSFWVKSIFIFSVLATKIFFTEIRDPATLLFAW
jgi:hypothetical protein